MPKKKNRISRLAIPQVTINQIEIMGKKFLGRRVRLVTCRLTVMRKYDEDYIEVGLNDGRDYGACFAYIDTMGEFITSIDEDAILNVEGVVMEINGNYELLADKITVRGKMNDLQW